MHPSPWGGGQEVGEEFFPSVCQRSYKYAVCCCNHGASKLEALKASSEWTVCLLCCPLCSQWVSREKECTRVWRLPASSLWGSPVLAATEESFVRKPLFLKRDFIRHGKTSFQLALQSHCLGSSAFITLISFEMASIFVKRMSFLG